MINHKQKNDSYVFKVQKTNVNQKDALDPPEYKIAGYTLDENNIPLPNTLIFLFEAETKDFVAETTSNTEGYYEITVENDTTNHFITAWNDEYHLIGTTDKNLTGTYKGAPYKIWLYPPAENPKDVTLRPLQQPYFINLIEKAIQYTYQHYNEIISETGVINEPLTPKAKRSYQYLLLRESINVGCSEATKLILEPYKKPIVYGILKRIVQEIFNYGKNKELINLYNNILDETLGIH
jgi:hypothetical protein